MHVEEVKNHNLISSTELLFHYLLNQIAFYPAIKKIYIIRYLYRDRKFIRSKILMKIINNLLVGD